MQERKAAGSKEPAAFSLAERSTNKECGVDIDAVKKIVYNKNWLALSFCRKEGMVVFRK